MNSSEIRKPDTAESLCSNKLQIPIYQRLFVWGKNEINKLLDDLYKAFNEKGNAPYYIGVITVREQEDGTLEIVDGQQRLTFLTLFGCEMMRLHYSEVEWGNFIRLDIGKLRIHYVGRDEDEKDINDFLDNGAYAQNPNFKVFHDCFENFAAGKDFSALSKYVFSHASFLLNILPVEYTPLDLNLYFEKMNSTGIQLTPLEQLKGRFAQYADRWNKCIYVDEITDAEVGGLQEKATLADVMSYEPSSGQQKNWLEAVSKSPGTLKVKRRIIRPEILVLHTLSLLSDSNDVSFDERKLLETFELKLDESRKEDFIKLLEEYTKWIDANIIHIREEEEGLKMPYAIGEKAEDNIKMEDDNDGNIPEEKRKLIQYQSMLFVSGYNEQKWILEMYKECGKGERSLDLKTLQEWDKNKNEHCRLGEMENWYYGQNLLQVFTRLEYCLWEYVCHPEPNAIKVELPWKLTPGETDAVKDYVFRRNNFSVEHFHPQTDANSSNNELWNAEYAPDQDRKYNCSIPKDGFGNLALISAGRNAEYSNLSVAAKYDRIVKLVQEKRMECIKLLFMCKACDAKDENWTPDVADKLADAMYQLLRNNGYIKDNEQANSSSNVEA